MAEFNNDYQALANCLQVMNKRLVLLNPVRCVKVTRIEILIEISAAESIECKSLKQAET